METKEVSEITEVSLERISKKLTVTKQELAKFFIDFANGFEVMGITVPHDVDPNSLAEVVKKELNSCIDVMKLLVRD